MGSYKKDIEKYGLVIDIGNISYENKIRQYLFKFHQCLGTVPLTLILYWNLVQIKLRFYGPAPSS